MTQEEKAKRYDEALKYGQYLINERCKEGADGSFHRADLDKMFPELTESENDRIRKEIVHFLREGKPYNCPNSVKRQEWANWLEQQGEKNEIDYNEELKKCKANPLYFFDKYVKAKLKEQNSSWNEYDEERH